MKFRKKPVVVEASQWFKRGDHAMVVLLTGVDENCQVKCDKCDHYLRDHGAIYTLETREGGEHVVCPGDWIIKGVNREHYACKPDVFEKSYEPVP